MWEKLESTLHLEQNRCNKSLISKIHLRSYDMATMANSEYIQKPSHFRQSSDRPQSVDFIVCSNTLFGPKISNLQDFDYHSSCISGTLKKSGIKEWKCCDMKKTSLDFW